SYVQGTETTADRSGEGAFDADYILFNCVKGLIRKPVAIVLVGCLLAAVNLHPGDGLLTAVGFLNSRVGNLDHDRGNINTDAITFNEGNDGTIGDVEGIIFIDGNLLAFC